MGNGDVANRQVRICHYCQFQFPIASVVVSYKLPVPGVTSAAALQRTAANGRKVWECFMLGVDPTKADDDFKITRFWMENGEPKFEFSHSADGSGNSFVPRLKVKGMICGRWRMLPITSVADVNFQYQCGS